MKTITMPQRTPLIATILFAAFVLVLAPAVHADTLTRQLQLGMTGSDVGSLQTFLASDANMYPQGLITNYFGFLTKSAVANFQSANGIAAVGRVGPVTLIALNAQMNGGSNNSLGEGAGKVTNVGTSQPVLSNIVTSVTTNSATITWVSNMAATARVRYSTVWPFNMTTASSVVGNSGSNTQSVTISNLSSNTNYYYVLESLTPSGDFSWSTAGVYFKTN